MDHTTWQWDSASKARAASSTVATGRDFLRGAGLVGPALVSGGWTEDSSLTEPSPVRSWRSEPRIKSRATILDFSADVGVLNYAYALEQLEASFYIRALQFPYSGMSLEERRVLQDVRAHEVAHRDFFKAVLGRKAIPALMFDFNGVNFGSRSGVLAAARKLEDTAVGAYNGVVEYLRSDTYLAIAGEITVVETRHAVAIREMLDPTAAGRTRSALDAALTPTMVLTTIDRFIIDPISVVHT